MTDMMKVMVLAGGPDRERAVSLQSGREVAEALRAAGHEVVERDVMPTDLGALEAFKADGFDVAFPCLHGPWGEGGGLQAYLTQRGVTYVGSLPPAAQLCMNKFRTKSALTSFGVRTAAAVVVGPKDRVSMPPPVVVKPVDEGSSFDLTICRTVNEIDEARQNSHERHPHLMVEHFIDGRELTVGVLGTRAMCEVLPTIEVVPATEYYDYEAKYERDDTQYRFDIDLPQSTLMEVQRFAKTAHARLGCRHLSRVDFIVDQQNAPWVLEVNTMPGMTTHSLVPKAASEAGMDMAQLCDKLVRMALEG